MADCFDRVVSHEDHRVEYQTTPGDSGAAAAGRRPPHFPTALLWIDEGRTREEVADLLGVSSRQVGDWLRIFRNKGLDELCIVHYRGDPGRLRPAQVEQLRQEIAKGVFCNAKQVQAWIEEQFGIVYSTTGVKDLLHRIGASFHKVSGFFLEGGPEEAASVRAEVSAASA
jgi:transposase